MCGIAGFSLSTSSTIKVRQLSNALLRAIEDRGYMASGYAWQADDRMGYYKQAVTGSKLPLKSMPKTAKSVILHTRLATHGSIEDNRNNHPVMSPTNDIALVHNGVIYNHSEVRTSITGYLPDVDTSVIPALIEQQGIEAIDALDGDAAIAWFNKREPNTLHVARYQHSPLVMCQVEDGSFIFCSTEQLLWRVLIELNLTPVWMNTANELDYFTVRDGKIISQAMLPEPKFVAKYDYAYYRHQTAGAKGSKSNMYGDPWFGVGSHEYEEAWDTPSFVSQLDDEDIVDAEEVDEYDIPLTHAKWYTRIYDELLQEENILHYLPNEGDLWKNELFMLANEDTLTLIDYGTVNAALAYVSTTTSMDF
jgi:hypothetical protein